MDKSECFNRLQRTGLCTCQFNDCTYGAGGYSKAILKYPNTKVIDIDRDRTVKHYSKDLEKHII